MYHIFITCSPGAWLGICHVLITCSSGACNAYAMPYLYVISELRAHMPCPHCMQFWSLHGTCHATITCSPGIYTGHMSCHHQMQFRSLWYICHAPNYCFVLLCITSYYFGLLCNWLHSEPYRYYGPYTPGPLRHALCHHCMEFWSLDEHMPLPVTCSSVAWETYALLSLHAVFELATHRVCPHYMQSWSLQA